MGGDSDGEGGSEDMDYNSWTEVGNKKRARSRSSRSGSRGDGREKSRRMRERIAEKEGFKIIVRFKDGNDIRKIRPVVLTRGLKEEVGEIVMAKVLADGGLLIQCKDEGQRGKAMKLKKVCNIVVESVKKLNDGPFVRGVIYDIPVEENVEEPRASMKGGKIIGIKRLQARRAGERVDSLSVLLDFEERVLPDSVPVGYLRYRVRAYVPPPLRCYKCQKYGHIAAACKGKQRCGKCGGEHDFGKCEAGTDQMCKLRRCTQCGLWWV